MARSSSRKVVDVLTYHGWGGYFFEDIDHIRKKYIQSGERYHTPTKHGRYPFVRTPAPVVGVGLKLDDGSLHWGDAVAVSFGGKAGRVAPSKPQDLTRWFKGDFRRWCAGKKIQSWLDIEKQFLKEFSSSAPFVRYAISQALLSAASHVTTQHAVDVISGDLGIATSKGLIPLHGSSGANLHETVDRMLARRIMYLPQGQFENLKKDIGDRGENLLNWIKEFKKRAAKFKYKPTLTLDFHGALDNIFDGNDTEIAAFITKMANVAKPHALHVESPIVGTSLKDHANRLGRIRSKLKMMANRPRIIADEWANETGDINYLLLEKVTDGIHIKMPDTGSLFECSQVISSCRKAGVFTLLGGSCTETDLGAKASVQLALACKPDALLVKPGMGFDEAYSAMFNEMARYLVRR